ncbi:MAG: hypothetical protein FJ135_01830 [Deltaproteobacteria bacterium]|nr:hypothetical protein [Deltaproteobacteria bacterium]
MADFVQINATGAVVACDPQNKIQVNALGMVVVYSLEPVEGNVQINAAGAVAVYQTAPPPRRIFPVPTRKTRWQSHPNKRKFPVVV